jgi:ArsR family transcriptional regulator, arsenate/arsenite/antimonite-responsive transcriptional repressor
LDTIKLAKVLEALSHPKRLELFFLIAEKREADLKQVVNANVLLLI